MAKTSESIAIKASPKKCFKVITDYKSYPKFLKEMLDVKIGKKTKTFKEVTYTLDVIKKITYTLKMVEKPHKLIKWSFIKGDLMASNEGEWVLEKSSNGTTFLTYNIDISFGLFVPNIISKKLIEFSLPAMLKDFKKRIEVIK